MGAVEVVAVGAVAKLERLFEGVTVQGFALWFNVEHADFDEASPVLSVGGLFGTRGGEEQILLERRGDSWIDLAEGSIRGGAVPDFWEQALPWVVADGVWREVRRRVVVRGLRPRGTVEVDKAVGR